MTKENMIEAKDENLEEGIRLTRELNAWFDRNPKYYMNRSSRKIVLASQTEYT